MPPKWFELCPDLDQAPRDGLKPNQARQKWRRDLNRVNTYCLSMPRRKFADHRGRSSAMLRIDVRALPDSLSFASQPKSVLHSFLSVARQVFPLVLLRPTRAGCVNCSFESPFTIRSWVVSRRATSHLSTVPLCPRPGRC